jgi:hypothetical protein
VTFRLKKLTKKSLNKYFYLNACGLREKQAFFYAKNIGMVIAILVI